MGATSKESLQNQGAVPADAAFGGGTNADGTPFTVTVVDGGGSITVDGAVAVTAGTGAGDLGKVEDAAHSSGDVGVMALAVRNDANAARSGADGDYTPIAVDAAGNPQCDVLTQVGAPNIANGQATAGAASGQLVAARATRRSVTVRNTDAANSCYVGAGVVSAANGFPLKAGESISINTTAAVNGIRATADVVVAYLEEYD